MGRRRGLPQNDRHRYVRRQNNVNDVVVSFGVHSTTIWRLAQRFRTAGTA